MVNWVPKTLVLVAHTNPDRTRRPDSIFALRSHLQISNWVHRARPMFTNLQCTQRAARAICALSTLSESQRLICVARHVRSARFSRVIPEGYGRAKRRTSFWATSTLVIVRELGVPLLNLINHPPEAATIGPKKNWLVGCVCCLLFLLCVLDRKLA